VETAADDTALEVLINVAVLVHVRLRRKVRRQPLPFAGAVSAAKAVPSKAHVLTFAALCSALLPAEAVPPTPGPIALGAGQVPGGPHNKPNTPGAPPPCATLTSFRTCFRSQETAGDGGGFENTFNCSKIRAHFFTGGPGCSSDSPNSSAGACWRGRRGH
jgi:hypothetical protein